MEGGGESGREEGRKEGGGGEGGIKTVDRLRYLTSKWKRGREYMFSGWKCCILGVCCNEVDTGFTCVGLSHLPRAFPPPLLDPLLSLPTCSLPLPSPPGRREVGHGVCGCGQQGPHEWHLQPTGAVRRQELLGQCEGSDL